MKTLKIGTRLAVGFGLMLTLMIVSIAIGMACVNDIGNINRKLIDEDWLKTDAASTVSQMTRANAQRSMELLIEHDAAKRDRINEKIASNKKTIDSALETLVKLVSSPEGKTLLAKIKQERIAYVTSFTSVGKLVAEDNWDQAAQLMKAETLLALDALQETIQALVVRQKKLVDDDGEKARHTISQAHTLMLGLGALAVLFGVLSAYLTTRSIVGPIKRAVAIAETVASGDLTSRIDATSEDETGQLLHALKAMNDSLVKIVGEVRGGTDAIATASSQIASGNLDLSSRTEQQAGSLEETASSMDELTTTVRQNADNARQAKVLAVATCAVAVKGGAVVSQVVSTMGSINDSAKEIVDIIGVIEGIAFQTNILALNAAVEAARAGEQGRGFAVVATEVRTLAQRSAAAAKAIKTLIGNSVEKVDAGAKLVDQAGATMDEIIESVRRVTAIMGEITAAGEEQTAGIEQINEAIAQLDVVTQQNAALVEEAASASASLKGQAVHLAQAVSVFKLNGGQAASVTRLEATPRSRAHFVPEVTIKRTTQFKRVANAKPGSNTKCEAF